MTAKDLRSWESVEEGLKALQGPEEGRMLTRRPVLRLEGAGAGTLGGMFFGVGAVAAGVRFWNHRFDREDLPGDFAVGTTILRLLGSLAFGGGEDTLVQRIDLALDGQDGTPHDALLCMVSTLDRLLLGVRPYWGGNGDGMHLTLVERGARGLWWRLPRLAMGRPGRVMRPGTGYLSCDPGRVDLTFDGAFVIDGEVFEARADAGPLTLTAVEGQGWLVPAGTRR